MIIWSFLSFLVFVITSKKCISKTLFLKGFSFDKFNWWKVLPKNLLLIRPFTLRQKIFKCLDILTPYLIISPKVIANTFLPGIILSKVYTIVKRFIWIKVMTVGGFILFHSVRILQQNYKKLMTKNQSIHMFPFLYITNVQKWSTFTEKSIDLQLLPVFSYSQTCLNYHLYMMSTHLRWPMLSLPKPISIQLFLYKTTTYLLQPATALFCCPPLPQIEKEPV